MTEAPVRQQAGLADGRWHTLTLAEQLGNIGSEVSRAIRAKRQGNDARQQRALYRALELFDLSATDPKLLHRLREIRRAREVVVDFVAGDNSYGSTDRWLDAYFTSFAYAARRGH